MLLGLLATAAGVALLSKSADEFVNGAAGIARLLRISPIVIGAVIIGFGTSAPEMLVSGIAAVKGDGDLGVGNIIGSNIANLSMILGAAALLIPLKIDSPVLRREAPLATAGAIVFVILLQGGLSLLDGIVLLIFMVVGIYLLVTSNGANSPLAQEVTDEVHAYRSTRSEALRTIVGLIGTVGGAWVLVWGATTVADELGFNDGFVGLTLVAVGTSLPELVTAVAAARAGHDELIVGNLLGSNVFNSLGVGAVVGLLGDGALVDDSLAGIDSAMMLAVCTGVFGLMWIRRRVERLDGIVLLGVFAAFIVITYLGEADSAEALLSLS